MSGCDQFAKYAACALAIPIGSEPQPIEAIRGGPEGGTQAREVPPEAAGSDGPAARLPQLTREVRELKARAAADMRSVGSCVASPLIEDLRRRGPGRGRPARGVSLGDERSAYEVAVPLTAEQKRKVEARARAEVRSVSSYVALLIVAALGRPTTFA